MLTRLLTALFARWATKKAEEVLEELIEPELQSLSESGQALIKKFEGYRKNAYQCTAKKWTIGWGVTSYPDGTKVKKGDVLKNKEEAQIHFDHHIQQYEDAVRRNVKVELNQNQFDALVSWVYNFGEKKFLRSTMLRVLNEGRYKEVPNQMKRWTKVYKFKLKKYVDEAGLVKRRAAEAKLFSSQ